MNNTTNNNKTTTKEVNEEDPIHTNSINTSNYTTLSKKKTENHITFMTWSLISLTILLGLLCVLFVIVCIWKRQKQSEETRSLIKSTKISLPKEIEMHEEHAISNESQGHERKGSASSIGVNNQVFVIGNENIDLEENS